MTDRPWTEVALEEALDVCEEIVRAQWLHTGEGLYAQPNASTAEAIIRLLVNLRADRWDRTPTGLRWHPEGR